MVWDRYGEFGYRACALYIIIYNEWYGLINRKWWSDERWKTKDWYEHKDLGIRDKDIEGSGCGDNDDSWDRAIAMGDRG